MENSDNAKWYKFISDIPLSNYLQITSHYLDPLIISGKPDRESLQTAYSNLLDEVAAFAGETGAEYLYLKKDNLFQAEIQYRVISLAVEWLLDSPMEAGSPKFNDRLDLVKFFSYGEPYKADYDLTWPVQYRAELIGLQQTLLKKIWSLKSSEDVPTMHIKGGILPFAIPGIKLDYAGLLTDINTLMGQPIDPDRITVYEFLTVADEVITI